MLGRILRGLQGLGTRKLARKLAGTFEGTRDPLAISKMESCTCSSWEGKNEKTMFCAGNGRKRYIVSVRKTTTDRLGHSYRKPKFEADITTFEAPSADNWTPHRWKAGRSYLIVPKEGTLRAAQAAAKAKIGRLCTK